MLLVKYRPVTNPRTLLQPQSPQNSEIQYYTNIYTYTTLLRMGNKNSNPHGLKQIPTSKQKDVAYNNLQFAAKQQVTIQQLPIYNMDIVMEFLSTKEYLTIRSLNRCFRDRYSVNKVEKIINRVRQDLENAEEVYGDFEVDNVVQRQDRVWKLCALKFMFVTRDQGWATASGEWSWIEGMFLNEQGQNLMGEQNARQHMISNRKVSSYVQKSSKMLSQPKLINKLKKVRIILRSCFPGWKIYCRQARMVALYRVALQQ